MRLQAGARGAWSILTRPARPSAEADPFSPVVLLAALLGGLVGFQREQAGKAAGLRTHMLVALGAAFFVMIPYQAGMPLADLSRVLQGIITGVGFLGAGTILKRPAEEHIEGLTTAAGRRSAATCASSSDRSPPKTNAVTSV